jgi:hypothetical protein
VVIFISRQLDNYPEVVGAVQLFKNMPKPLLTYGKRVSIRLNQGLELFISEIIEEGVLC